MADQENGKIIPFPGAKGGPPPLSADKVVTPPQEGEQVPGELAVRELTEEEELIAEAWQSLYQNSERSIRLLKKYAGPLQQLATFAVASSIQAPQTQAVVYPHFASALANGFLLGYIAREKVGKKNAKRSGN